MLGIAAINSTEVYETPVAVGCDGIATLAGMNHVHPAIAPALAIRHPVANNPGDVIDIGLPFLHRAVEAAGFHCA